MDNPMFGRLITAMVTPFDSQTRIKETMVCRLAEHLIDNGSDTIVVCGTTGESPTLSDDEKLQLFKLVKQAVGSRARVIAGTGSNDTAASIKLTRSAADLGVDGALLVVPPYNKPSQEGLYCHFRAIAESVPALPCMLYNVPGRTASNLAPATVLRLARGVKNIVAIKEASGNVMQSAEIVAEAPAGFLVYSGDDGLTLPILSIGGVGVVSVASHLVGKEMKAAIEAFLRGDVQQAACLNARLLHVIHACFQPTTASPAPVKAGLQMIGLDVGGLRLPLVEANSAERAIMKDALLRAGIIS